MKMKVMCTIVTDTRFWDFNVFNTDTSTGVLTTRVLYRLGTQRRVKGFDPNKILYLGACLDDLVEYCTKKTSSPRFHDFIRSLPLTKYVF